MSRRKHQRSLEQHYKAQLAPWMAGSMGICVLLMVAIYVASMPL